MSKKPTSKEIQLFSTPRLDAYNNDMNYYFANIAESSEIAKILQIFEVALRNYIDELLTNEYQNKYWIFEHTHFESLKYVIEEINRHFKSSKKDICKDIINLIENDKPENYDETVSILTKHINNVNNKYINNKDKSKRYSNIMDIIINDKITDDDKLNRIINIVILGKQEKLIRNINIYVTEQKDRDNIYQEIYNLTIKTITFERHNTIKGLLLDDKIREGEVRDIIISRLSFGFWVNLQLFPNQIPKEKLNIKGISLYDYIKSKYKLKDEIEKIRKLRNRCSHEERIIEIKAESDGEIYYQWTQDTQEAIDAISLISKELFNIDVIPYYNQNLNM